LINTDNEYELNVTAVNPSGTLITATLGGGHVGIFTVRVSKG